MAAERQVARGEVEVNLGGNASEELQRLHAEYRATMASIDRMEAEATVSLATEKFDWQYKKAQDKVRILKAERASVRIGANTEELDRDILKAERAVRRLDGKRAEIDIDSRKVREGAKNVETLAKIESNRARAGARIAKQQEREQQALIRAEKQRQAEIERSIQAENKRMMSVARAASADERARRRSEDSARRTLETHRQADLTTARQLEKVSRLRAEYAKVADEVEKSARAMRGFHGPEMTAKLRENHAMLFAQWKRIKAEIEFMGGHPPPEINIDLDFDRRGLQQRLGRLVRSAGGRLANLGSLRILGNTLSTLLKVVATLGPYVVSLVGAVTSLAGVLGTGLAGGAAVAGGALLGLGLNIIGVVGSLKSAATSWKTYRQSADAATKAVAQYGAGSGEAEKALKKQQHALKDMPAPLRAAAKEADKFKSRWTAMTQGPADNFLGKSLEGIFHMANRLSGVMAANTNKTFSILQGRVTSFTRWASKLRQVRLFDSLGESGNKFLKPALSGVDHFIRGLLRIGESAARIFAGPAGNAIERWGKNFENANRSGGELDTKVIRLGNHFRDVIGFLGALGRLLKTVLGGGADEGDRLLRTMTKTLNKWNDFLKTPKGQREMEKFFQRSGKNAQQLFNALAPFVGLFVQWSNLMAPIANGATKALEVIGKAFNKLVDFLHLRSEVGALGGTIAAAFAFAKISSFVAGLARAAKFIREMKSIRQLGGIWDAFKGGTGASGVRASIVEAHAEGAAALRSAIIEAHTQGGAIVNREEVAGHTTGGAIVAREEIAGHTAGGAVGAGEAAVGGGLFARLFPGLTSGFKALAPTLGTVALRLTAIGTALYAAKKIMGDGTQWDLSQPAGDPRPGHGDIQKLTEPLDKWLAGLKEHTKDGLDTLTQFAESAGQSAHKGSQNFQRALQDLYKTPQGRKFVIDVATRGDARVMRTFARLAQSRFGRKILEVLSRGGPGAMKLMKDINAHRLSKKELRIIADSKNAQEALRRIQTYRLHRKILSLGQKGYDKVNTALKNLRSMHLPQKTLRIIGNSIVAVRTHKGVAKLSNISKTLKVLGTNRAARKAYLQAIQLPERALKKLMKIDGSGQSALDWFHRLQNLPDITHYVRWKSSGAMRAEGGPVTPEEKQMQKAEKVVQRANAREARQAVSQKVNSPTLLVGEEDRTEYVIATNPAYRQSNEVYLRMAAADLGFDVTPAERGQVLHYGKAPGGKGGHWAAGKNPYFSSMYDAVNGIPTSPRGSDDPWHRDWAKLYEANDPSKFNSGYHLKYKVWAPKRSINPSMWAEIGSRMGLQNDKNLGYSDIEQDKLEGIYNSAWGGYAGAQTKFIKDHTYEAPTWRNARDRRYHRNWGAGWKVLKQHGVGIHGNQLTSIEEVIHGWAPNESKQLVKNYNSVSDRLQSGVKIATRHKKQWDDEVTEIDNLNSAMAIADKRDDNAADYVDRFGTKHKNVLFGDMKKTRGDLIRRHRRAQEEQLEYFTGRLRTLNKDKNAPEGLIEQVQTIMQTLTKTRNTLIEDEIDNSGRIPSERPVSETQLTPDELIEAFNSPNFQIGGKQLGRYYSDLESLWGLAQGTSQVVGPNEDIDIASKQIALFQRLLGITQGKLGDPNRDNEKHVMPLRFQSAAMQGLIAARANLDTSQQTALSGSDPTQVVAARELSSLGRQFDSNIYGANPGVAPGVTPTTDPNTGLPTSGTMGPDPRFGTGGTGRSLSLAPTGSFQGAAGFASNRMSAPLFRDTGGQRSTGGGLFSTAGQIASARSATRGVSVPSGMVSAAGSQAPSSKVMNVTNNFLTQPSDPLTWSRSVQFDLELM